MTRAEVFQMVCEIGYPSAYHHFTNETAKAPPFVCFYYPGSNDFIADDHNYEKIEKLYIELYTNEKDFAAERAVEAVLRANSLPYTRDETYLDTEKLYMQLYTTEVLIDE